ncbi:MAG: rod shape-determining protein RodA [Alphaproteobacteria bacterium]
MYLGHSYREHASLIARLMAINWIVVALICLLGGIGVALLYSAAGADFDPWATRHMTRLALGFGIMLAAAVVDLRLWLRHAYWVFFVALVLLGMVELFGVGAMGAERWLVVGPVRVQPSEIMKVALVLALARYFHRLNFDDIGRPHYLIPPLLLIALPVAMVLRQPDLGTAGVLLMLGVVMFFLAGVRWWKFALGAALAVAAVPVAWRYVLHGYQKRRLLAFLDPESDPLGAGYHILQSKIALGAGGLSGKGFLEGSQSHLNFLPEIQTDFIFTILAEEFGLLGGLGLLALYGLFIVYAVRIAIGSRNQFGRLVAAGISALVFLHVFINMAMVMGLVPVVGVPLPLVSYGGTALLSLMFGFGLVLSVYVHRDARIGRWEDE